MNQVLRDKQGRRIGEIQDQGTRQIIRDAQRRRVGEGNLLTMLLPR